MVTVRDDNGCEYTDSVIIDSLDMPTPDFTATTVCLNEVTDFTSTSTSSVTTNIINYDWSFGSGNTSSIANPSHIFGTAGIHSVMHAVETNEGCIDTIYKDIEVYELSIADFTFTQELGTIFNTKTCFYNASIAGISYFWNFNFDGQTSTDRDPCIEFPNDKPGEYEVMLVTYTVNGCTDTVYKTIVIEDEVLVYIPTGFTPGGDNVNEKFGPVFSSSVNVIDYEFLVFDRWGEIIFKSSKVGENWDGKYNGKLSQDGAYAWKLNANVSQNGKANLKIQKLGHVVLVR